MSVLSDRWIKKMALEKEMLNHLFLSKKVKTAFPMDSLHLVMMQEFPMNLKFLPMLILLLLIQKILKVIVLFLEKEKNV